MKFELNSLSRNCSDEEIILEIIRVDQIIQKQFLVRKDFDQYSRIKSCTLIRRFGD